MRRFTSVVILLAALALGATASFAQDGKLKIKVTPKRAYVFVDGNAVRDGSQSISLPAGKHTVAVVSYGYKISTQDVDITSGKTTDLKVVLDAVGGPVNGPFGQILFEGGDGHSAVLLNGTTPPYFATHVAGANHDWWWHKQLLVPPGTYHVTVTRNGKDSWTGDVNVAANRKTIVNLNKNTQTPKDKKSLAKLSNVPRFTGGWISQREAIAQATGSFSSSTANINCGQSTNLSWQTAETVDANISGVGKVPLSGSQSVSPHQTTTYDFNSSGPGGTVKGTATVNVNTKVDESLSASQTELHYRKIGDKVVTQDSTTLTWQGTNADAATLTPGGTVAVSGNQTVQAEPSDTSQVPDGAPARTVDETKNYTLNETNVCGGSATQTVGLHFTGSVEPIPAVTLQSVFYPTDYPDKKNPQVGLVRSQQLALATLAGGFKKYLEYDPDARLSVEAHADMRGSKQFNQDLSERRVARIKQYLVEQGVPAAKIETAAYGKDRPLEKAAVKTLESSNPNTPPKARVKNAQADWLAYNRRADIILLPSGKKSAQFFPHTADDSGLIWQMPKPPLKKVQTDQ